MANDKDIGIILGADIPKSTVQIEADLKKIKPENLKVGIELDLDHVKKLKEQLEDIAKKQEKLQGYTKSKVDIKTTNTGAIDSASIKYYNELTKETVTQLYVIDKETGNLALKTKDLTTNYQAQAKSQEQQIENDKKLINGKMELSKLMDIETAKYNKSNITMNPDIQTGFKNSLDSATTLKDLDEVKHHITMAKLEYDEFNAKLEKQQPNKALDNMNKNLENMPSKIILAKTKFEELKSPTDKIIQNISKFDSLLATANSKGIVDDKTRVNAYNELSKSIEITTNEMKALKAVESQTAKQNSTANSIEQIGLKAQIGANRVRAFGNQLNSTARGKYADELKSLENAFKNIGGKEDLTKANTQLREFETRMRSMGNVGNTVFDKLKKNIGQFFSFIGAATVGMTLINSLKKAVSNVVELDKSLTDLRIATNGTYEETAKLLSSYNKLGKQMGATTKEVADSADSWLRQNKTLAETNTLVQDSMILSKLGQIDSANATQYLTSATKGYNVAVKDTIGIVDKLTAVDIQSATSASGLAEAMSKVANLANMSGVSMDKLLGYLALVGEVTQKNMSEVGNSFKLGTVAV